MDRIEIAEHNGQGFKSMISFESWRVALLNYCNFFSYENLRFMERHMLTDEVFILLEGEASLIIGEEQKEYRLEKNKLYNVKTATWHAVCMKENAKILIVENEGTDRKNSEYMKI